MQEHFISVYSILPCVLYTVDEAPHVPDNEGDDSEEVGLGGCSKAWWHIVTPLLPLFMIHLG